jgi:acyl dehydratase
MMRRNAACNQHPARLWHAATQQNLEESIMDMIGKGIYFEDLPVGYKFRTIGRTITEADITNFVGATGMSEVLFTDLHYLENETDFDGRLVPGALVYSAAEGLVMTATLQYTGVAFLGMELNMQGPVFAGDTIHVECEVVEARRTSKRPDRALVRTYNRVIKQDGTEVMTLNPLRMMKCRTEG